MVCGPASKHMADGPGSHLAAASPRGAGYTRSRGLVLLPGRPSEGPRGRRGVDFFSANLLVVAA